MQRDLIYAVSSREPADNPHLETAPRPRNTEERAAGCANVQQDLSVDELRCALQHLVRSVASAREDEHDQAEEYLRQAATSLGVNLTLQDAPPAESTLRPYMPLRGGLAPWQIQRVKSHIEAKLGLESLENKRLASIVGLTPFHFCRTFRQSFGESPHGYVMRRRVERAQGLMLQGTTVLSRIAIDCGFADQAHFTRVFRKHVGDTPGTWRRARCTGGGT